MTTRVPIASIRIDLQNQPRLDNLDAAHIEQLKEAVEFWPPLTVVPHDHDRFTLIDGFHRHAAAEDLGLDSVPVKIVDLPEDGDLLSLAFDLNARHGRPLTLADRKQYAGYLLGRAPTLADRVVGRRCGLAAATIAKVRSQLEWDGEIEPSTSRVGADGKTYVVPERQPGELPGPGLGQMIGDGLRGIVSNDHDRRQRKIVRYLQRLAVSLDDQYQLEGWDDAQDAVIACDCVLGPYKSSDLIEQLTIAAQRIIDIAQSLKSVA